MWQCLPLSTHDGMCGSPAPAGRMEGPASGAVGSVSLRDGVNGFEGAAVLLGSP